MYKSVTTTAEVREYLSTASAVGLDIETSPFESYRNESKAALDPHKAQITGISFSVAKDGGIYIPLTHRIGINIDNTIEFWDFLSDFLQHHNIPIIIHNAAFETAFFYARGIIPQMPIYDTITAAQMTIKENTDFRSLADSGLKTLVPELLGVKLPTFSDVTGNKHFDELDPQESATVTYACSDSDFALRLYYLFNSWFDKNLPKHRYIVEQIESPTAVYCGLMKYNGILVDTDLMITQKTNCENLLQKLKDEIHFIIGDIDIGANASTSAFKKYLYNELKLPVLKTTSKFQESSDEEAFVLLREWCNENRPELANLFTLILEYRRIGKLLSTYVEGYLKQVNSETGRLHPQFFQLGAESGRFSCRNPNVQNQSNDKDINTRNFIIASEGCSLIELDYSQIEARLAAFLSRDEHLLDIYRNDKDLHAMTTAAVFQISLESAMDKHEPHYKHRRTVAKATFFGFMYGMYGKTLQRNLKVSAGVNVTVDNAKTFLENLKRTYASLTAWQKHTMSDAKHNIYAETALGRRRYVPNIRSDNFIKAGGAERSALNHGVQGLAADLLKLSMGRIIFNLPLYIKPLFTVHDSLVFEVPDSKISEAAAMIKSAMEVPPPIPGFDVKIIAEVSVGKSYGKMEELA
jgi:DNA polymerase-1